MSLQCGAVVLLPDGAPQPAREARLPAQHPGLHDHGHPRSAGGGDQQPEGHGQQAGGPRYELNLRAFFNCYFVYFKGLFHPVTSHQYVAQGSGDIFEST